MRLPELPKRRADLIFRQVEEDFVVYDPVSHGTALINASMAILLDLCDGSRTLDDIATLVVDTYAGDRDEILAGLRSSLADLTARGFLRPSP